MLVGPAGNGRPVAGEEERSWRGRCQGCLKQVLLLAHTTASQLFLFYTFLVNAHLGDVYHTARNYFEAYFGLVFINLSGMVYKPGRNVNKSCMCLNICR